MYIFDLAAQHSQWIAARQQAAATNIANIDTPGYRAAGVAPFESVLERTALDMAATDAAHLRLEQAVFRDAGSAPGASWDVSHSGNSVTLEQELLTVGENGRLQAFDSNIQRVFQRMLLSSLKV